MTWPSWDYVGTPPTPRTLNVADLSNCNTSSLYRADFGNPCSPVLVIPTRFFGLQPAWATCTTDSGSFGRDLGFWDPDKVLSPASYLVSTTRDPQLTLPTLQSAAALRITTPPMPSSTGFDPPLPSLKASLDPPALETPTKYTSQQEPAAPTLVSTDPDSPAPVSHAPDDPNSFPVTLRLRYGRIPPDTLLLQHLRLPLHHRSP